MQGPIEKAIELQEAARTFRKKGDAMRKAARAESATEAYQSGLSTLNQALNLLKAQDEMLRAANSLESEEAAQALRELIEIYGARGGMHQRLGELDKSLASYAQGARLEEKFEQASTYNRLNAIKYSLLTGSDLLRSLQAKIQILANHIEKNLQSDKSFSDRGWAWADLGDCLALLDRSEEAGRAYATFIAKAEIKSPERTLDILKEIAATLQSKGDPDAARLVTAIDALQASLIAR